MRLAQHQRGENLPVAALPPASTTPSIDILSAIQASSAAQTSEMVSLSQKSAANIQEIMRNMGTKCFPLTVRNELMVLVDFFRKLHLLADFEPRLVFIGVRSHFALGLMLFQHFLNFGSTT